MQFNLVQEFIPFFLVFSRLGTTLIILPGIGDQSVASRLRFYIAAALTILLTPILPIPEITMSAPVGFLVLISQEMLIGFFIGFLAKVTLSLLDVVGSVVSFEMSFSSATIYDPTFGGQKNTIGTFFTLSLTLLFLISDGYIHVLSGLIESYKIFPVGKKLLLGDHASSLSVLLGDSFTLAIRLSAPFLLAGTILQIAFGFLNRLMPQLQIFFLGMPVQILLGFLLLIMMIAPLLEKSLQFLMNHLQV